MDEQKYVVFNENPSGDSSLDTMLYEIFKIVDQNYVRRTEYDAKINELSRRISILELGEEIVFTCNMDTGNLQLEVPNDCDDIILEIVGDQLVLTSNDTPADIVLEKYRFDINDAGYLVATYN